MPLNERQQLDTPSLILDKGKLQNNIDRMKTHLAKLGTGLRPHVKTNKCLDIAHIICGGQTRPTTVSTIREAEYFFEDGFEDITYAVGIVPHKLPRIKKLMDAGANIKLILDDPSTASALCNYAEDNNVTFKVFIEIDSDNHRAGLAPDNPVVIKLAEALDKSTHINFLGFLTHAGESYNCKTTDEIRRHAELERDAVLKCAENVKGIGISPQILSVGSSPTATFSNDLTGADEVRAGSFVFQRPSASRARML